MRVGMVVVAFLASCGGERAASILLFDGAGPSRGDVAAIETILRGHGLAYAFPFCAAEARGIRKAAVWVEAAGEPRLQQYWEDGPVVSVLQKLAHCRQTLEQIQPGRTTAKTRKRRPANSGTLR